MVNEEIISIKNRFVKHLHPECIFLFGSYATDMYTDESDYDYYVVMPDGTDNLLQLTQEAYLCLLDMDRKPVDIVVNTSSRFRELAQGMTLERRVLDEGIQLYA